MKIIVKNDIFNFAKLSQTKYDFIISKLIYSDFKILEIFV